MANESKAEREARQGQAPAPGRHDPKEMWSPQEDPSPRSFEKTVKDRDVTKPETPVPPLETPTPVPSRPIGVKVPVQTHPVTGQPEAHPNPMLGTNPNPFAPVSLVNRVQGVIDEMAKRPVTPVLTKAIAALKAVAEDIRAEDHPHTGPVPNPMAGPNEPLKGMK